MLLYAQQVCIFKIAFKKWLAYNCNFFSLSQMDYFILFKQFSTSPN